MGILRHENRRYNAHFVFYKPIKISLIELVAFSRFFEDLLLVYLPPILMQVSERAIEKRTVKAHNPNILRAYAHTRGISKKCKTFCKESLDICRRCEYIYARKKGKRSMSLPFYFVKRCDV